MKKKLFLFSTLLLSIASCTFEKGEAPTLGCSVMSFSTDIQPIINAKCATAGCHVSGGTGPGDFTLYLDLKGKIDGGIFKHRVFDLKDMPQAGSPPLTEDEIHRLKCWVEQGAPNN
ncbi:MAG: hypothetical protein ACJ77K_11565 [Bacteroidia bacterium]